MLIKVEDDKALVKDSHTGAILVTDKDALNVSRRRRNIYQEQENRLSMLEKKLAALEELLNNLKE